MKTVFAQATQDITDLAVELYGTVEGLFRIAFDNGLAGITAPVFAGQPIRWEGWEQNADTLPPSRALASASVERSTSLQRYMTSRAVKIASGYAREAENTPCQDGIGHLMIGGPGPGGSPHALTVGVGQCPGSPSPIGFAAVESTLVVSAG